MSSLNIIRKYMNEKSKDKTIKETFLDLSVKNHLLIRLIYLKF